MRYAYPGYTFLVFAVIALIDRLPVLLSSIPREPVGILLSAVFALGGAPLGFLISQPWYVFFREVLWTRRGVIRDFMRQRKIQSTEEALAIADQIIISDEKVHRYMNQR